MIEIEELDDKKLYKIGVIDYKQILGVRPEGDGSFDGVIFYIKPNLFQLDKYSIAFKSFRYYPVDKDSYGDVAKPIVVKMRDMIRKIGLSIKYNLWLRWKFRNN